MHTNFRRITHFNYAGTLSMLAVGILGFPIPKEMFLVFLASIVAHGCANINPRRTTDTAPIAAGQVALDGPASVLR
jgi:hypothetical protein